MSTHNKLINRRHDQRLPLQGLELKIRKTGFNHNPPAYHLCRSIDLSLNGLAFANDELTLKVPEKIEFILNLEEHEIKGNGVICNKRTSQNETQYGLMFLNVTPEISRVFDNDQLSTHELEHLTINLAEQFVFSNIKTSTPLDKLILKRQQQLFDACRCYLVRLGEMGVRMPDMNTEVLLLPGKAVKIFRTPAQTLLLRWHNEANANAQEMTIAIQQNSLDTCFMVDEKKACHNILQVLEILGDKLQPSIHFI